MGLISWGQTDVGRIRDHNEDSFRVDLEREFYIVADGVGGGAAGEVASSMAIDIIYSDISQEYDALKTEGILDSADGRARMMARVHVAVSDATQRIHQRGQTETRCRGMSTTVVLFQVIGNWAVVGHVGDSRLYMIRDGIVYQVTEDHTLVQMLLNRGALTPEEAATYPNKNIITRAVGRQPAVEADVLCVDVLPNDVFLLCSDGLTDLVPTPEIHQIAISEDPKAAAGKLIDLANKNGGTDNISVVLIHARERRVGKPKLRTEQKVGLLQEVFLFRDLTFQETLRVLNVVSEERRVSGETIIREGEPGDKLYILVEGEADVLQQGVHMTRIGQGGHFGELGLITDGVRTATVVARGDVSLLSIGRDDLFGLVRADHSLAVKLLWGFLQNVTGRMKELSTDLAQVKSKS
jgi:serine/threonine protein phosphatase PrpC